MSPKRPSSSRLDLEPAVGQTTVGLCDRCRHARLTRNNRGHGFWRCGLSDVDPDFERYPAIPVHRCPGFVTATAGGEAS